MCSVHWNKPSPIVDNFICWFFVKLRFTDYNASMDESEDYLDYLTGTIKKDENRKHKAHQERWTTMLLLNGIYAMGNLIWPIWLMIKRMNNTLREDDHEHPPFIYLLGVLPLFVGLPVSDICNKKIKSGRNFPDSDNSVEGAILSILSQVSFLWLTKKIVLMANFCMIIENDYLHICAITDLNILIACTSLTLIQYFCTQSNYLILCPIMYIVSYFI